MLKIQIEQIKKIGKDVFAYKTVKKELESKLELLQNLIQINNIELNPENYKKILAYHELLVCFIDSVPFPLTTHTFNTLCQNNMLYQSRVKVAKKFDCAILSHCLTQFIQSKAQFRSLTSLSQIKNYIDTDSFKGIDKEARLFRIVEMSKITESIIDVFEIKMLFPKNLDYLVENELNLIMRDADINNRVNTIKAIEEANIGLFGVRSFKKSIIASGIGSNEYLRHWHLLRFLTDKKDPVIIFKLIKAYQAIIKEIVENSDFDNRYAIGVLESLLYISDNVQIHLEEILKGKNKVETDLEYIRLFIMNFNKLISLYKIIRKKIEQLNKTLLDTHLNSIERLQSLIIRMRLLRMNSKIQQMGNSLPINKIQ